MKWPDLKLSPINLWNAPAITIKKDIIDKIEEEVFRYFIRYRGNFPQNLYLGEVEYNELVNLIESNGENKVWLNVIKVKKDTFLKVG